MSCPSELRRALRRTPSRSPASPTRRSSDLSRRLLGAATGLHPDAELACAAINMAVATRGGIEEVHQSGWREDPSKRAIFHTDRGSTYTAHAFTKLCQDLGTRQYMRRGGSGSHTAAGEGVFSSL